LQSDYENVHFNNMLEQFLLDETNALVQSPVDNSSKVLTPVEACGNVIGPVSYQLNSFKCDSLLKLNLKKLIDGKRLRPTELNE